MRRWASLSFDAGGTRPRASTYGQRLFWPATQWSAGSSISALARATAATVQAQPHTLSENATTPENLPRNRLRQGCLTAISARSAPKNVSVCSWPPSAISENPSECHQASGHHLSVHLFLSGHLFSDSTRFDSKIGASASISGVN